MGVEGSCADPSTQLHPVLEASGETLCPDLSHLSSSAVLPTSPGSAERLQQAICDVSLLNTTSSLPDPAINYQFQRLNRRVSSRLRRQSNVQDYLDESL